MNTSSLSDSVVLRETKFSPPDAKGRVQLSFVLPSGRKVTSTDWLVPGEIKGKVLIAWANAIRAEDAFDIQQREEQEKLARAEKRARQLTSDVLSETGAPAQKRTSDGQADSLAALSAGTSPSSSSPSSLPDDPRQLVLDKVGLLIATRRSLESQRDEILAKLVEVNENISRWESIVDSLYLHSPPPATPAAIPDQSATPESQSTESSATSASTPPLGRAQRRKRRRKESSNETANPSDAVAVVAPEQGG